MRYGLVFTYPVVLFLIWFRIQKQKRKCYVLGSLNSNKVNAVTCNVGNNFSMRRWDYLPPFLFPFSCSFYILCSWHKGLSSGEFFTMLPRRKSKDEVSEALKHAMRKTDHGLWLTGLWRNRACSFLSQPFVGMGRQETANWFSKISQSQPDLSIV